MNNPDTKRNIIVLAVLIIVGIAAYYFLIKKGDTSTDVVSPGEIQVNAEVEEVLGLLQELQAININPDGIANLNATVFFRNFHQPIVPGPRGKANPFIE